MKDIKILTLCIGLGMSSIALANTTGIELHNNAHNMNGAKQLYQSWKDNKTQNLDPFKRIKDGYASDYSATIRQVENETLNESYATSVEGMNDLVLTDLESRKANRSEGWQSAYSIATEDDQNTVDRSLFDEEISDYREQRGVDAAIHYENMKIMLSNYSVNASTAINAVNSENSANTFNASSNIIRLMNNDVTDSKTSLRSMFQDNLERAKAVSNMTAATLEVATTFSETCSACVPPPVYQSPPPTQPLEPTPPEDDVIYYTPPDTCRGGWYDQDMRAFYICD